MTVSSTKQWALRDTVGFDGFELEEAPIPHVGDNDVLVKIHAASLNYRDIMIANGAYTWPPKPNCVPCSDGAGEVIQTGSKVVRFKPGYRVMTAFAQGHIAGPIVFDGSMVDLGASGDGVLRQYGVFNEQGLVLVPSHLSYVEASTLPCAAVTAWNALFGGRKLEPGDTVLTQGTGGVSIFAIQFAVAAGAEVVATTSSAEKAERVRGLGVRHVINYREDANWGATAKKLSLNGRGADFILEVGGPNTMAQSVNALAMDGVIAVIGTRGGKGGSDDEKNGGGLASVHNVMGQIRRIMVGNRMLFEQMCRAIEVNGIRPVVDRVFGFGELKEALAFLDGQGHFGKVVVRI